MSSTRQLRPRKNRENSREPSMETSESGKPSFPIGKHDGNNPNLPATLIQKREAKKQKEKSLPLHMKLWNWLYLNYFRYETTFGLYMTVLWEKTILNILVLTGMLFTLITMWEYIPLRIREWIVFWKWLIDPSEW